MLTTPESIRTLQRKLYTKAKQEPAYRFYALYDKVWRSDILMFAYRLVRANKGSPGVDGVNFEDVEQKIGIDKFLSELAQDLKDKTYHPSPVRRVMIPKADGSLRPLGIPTIRDRVAQMAVKLVIEPIFEADFCPNSYGFRPKKSAHDAVDEIADALHQGYINVIDADLSKYFDSIPHAKLLAVVAERIVDGAILHIIKLWLKAPVIGEDEDGTRRNVGGGKANSRGTPQGGVISPLLANCYLHILDRIWARHRLRWKLKARIVRYADDCVPRRRTGGRKSSVQLCCTRDGGRPLEVGVQAQASNQRLLLRLRGVVVSEPVKGWARLGQVRIVKSNASEPLMTCRKRREDVETAGESLPQDKSGGSLLTARAASGMEAARARSRLLCGTWEPVTPMSREKRKGRPPECESTDAGYRDGATRSSEESPVMGLERRGCPIQPETREQLATGGLT